MSGGAEVREMPVAGFRNPHEPTGFRVITGGDHQHHQHFKTFVDVGIGKKDA